MHCCQQITVDSLRFVLFHVLLGHAPDLGCMISAANGLVVTERINATFLVSGYNASAQYIIGWFSLILEDIAGLCRCWRGTVTKSLAVLARYHHQQGRRCGLSRSHNIVESCLRCAKALPLNARASFQIRLPIVHQAEGRYIAFLYRIRIHAWPCLYMRWCQHTGPVMA